MKYILNSKRLQFEIMYINAILRTYRTLYCALCGFFLVDRVQGMRLGRCQRKRWK
jgi:hypothetical protein